MRRRSALGASCHLSLFMVNLPSEVDAALRQHPPPNLVVLFVVVDQEAEVVVRLPDIGEPGDLALVQVTVNLDLPAAGRDQGQLAIDLNQVVVSHRPHAGLVVRAEGPQGIAYALVIRHRSDLLFMLGEGLAPLTSSRFEH